MRDSVLTSVRYEGRCVDPYEDGVCGEDALGERLFVGEDDTTVYCDCDEVGRSGSILSGTLIIAFRVG